MVLLAYLSPLTRLAAGKYAELNLIWTLGGFLVLTVCIASPPTIPALFTVILVTGGISGIVVSAQRNYVEGRLQGLGLNPNYLALYLAVPIVISIGLAVRHRNLLWLVPGVACLPALLETKSRGGFLAMAAGAGFLLIQGRSPRQKILVALVALVAMGAVTAVLAFPAQLNEIANLGAGNRPAGELGLDNLVRVQVAWFAVHTALSHPLLGIGFGQFPSYAAVSSSFGIYITTTNEYLLLASETGLITLAAFLVLLWLAIRGPCHGDMVIVRAVIVACVVCMLFADTFGSPDVALPFWACLGMLLARNRAPADTAPAASDYTGTSRAEISRWPISS